MVLDAEDRQPGVAEPFEGLVVEVDVAGSTSAGSVAGSTAKPWFWVVISTLPVRSLRTGWLAPRWPNLSLNVRRAEGLAEELVAQADAEDRDAPRLGGGPDQGPERRGRARRAGGGRRGRSRGRCRRARARGSPRPGSSRGRPSPGSPISTRWRGMFHFMPKSSATTCGRRRRRGRARPRASGAKRARRSPAPRSTAPSGMTSRARSRPTRPGLALRLGDEAGVVEVGRREDALHRPALAGQADQGPGVDPLDADDAVLGEVVVERPAATVVAGQPAQLADDEPADPGPAGSRRPRR